jgi:hypothetical protein
VPITAKGKKLGVSRHAAKMAAPERMKMNEAAYCRTNRSYFLSSSFFEPGK